LVNRPKKDLVEDAIDLRREKVLELTSQGYSQRQIENMLNISHGTVNNDQAYLRQKAKENIRKYIDEKLPEEYEKCLVGITSILKEAWNTSKQENIDNKEKIQALSLAKECYSMKLDLLTNATVVDDAIRFVSQKANEKVESSSGNSNEDDKEESKEPDYDEDEDQLGEEKEEQTREVAITTNQVF
jgi:predicted transcriptional regulator